MWTEETLTNGFIRLRGENSAVHSAMRISALLSFSEARCFRIARGHAITRHV